MSSSGRTSQEHAQHEGAMGFLPSEEWSQTWPASGTAWCGILSERPTSEPRTAASGSSSWPSGPVLPTPSASSSTGPGKHGTGGLNLQTRIHLLMTPDSATTERA